MAWAYQLTCTYPTTLFPGDAAGGAHNDILAEAMQLEAAGTMSASTRNVVTSDAGVQGLQIIRQFSDMTTLNQWQALVDTKLGTVQHVYQIDQL
jgi:hypothetical protein